MTTNDELRKRLLSAQTAINKSFEKNTSFVKASFFTPKVGKNVLRILPQKNDQWPFKRFKMHQMYLKEGFRAVTCMSDPEWDDVKGPMPVCPLCKLVKELYQLVAELSKSKDPDSKKLMVYLKNKASALRAREKVVANVFELGGENNPKLWEFSYSLCSDIFMIIDENGEIFLPEGFRDLLLNRTGTTKDDTNYNVTLKREVLITLPKNWEETVRDLHELKTPSEEVLTYLAEKLVDFDAKDITWAELPFPYKKDKDKTEASGDNDASDVDENDAPPPPPPKKRPAPPKKVVEPESEEEYEEEYEEETPPPPPKKRPAPVKKPVQEEEYEEETFEEEVEPPKKAAPAKKNAEDPEMIKALSSKLSKFKAALNK